MSKFLNWLIDINRHYDRMKEPQRFIVGMAIMMPGLVLISAPEQVYPILFLLGCLYTIALLALRILGTRMKRKSDV